MSYQWPQLTLLIICLVLLWVAMPAIAQEYYADDFEKNTTGNYESAGPAKWTIQNGELLSRDSDANWNVLLLKEKFWKKWTEYTYEVKVMPYLKKKQPAEFIYITFRYTQKLGRDRQNFFTYLMDESNINGLYIDRFIDGTRIRPVPGTMTFEGAWKNEAKAYTIKLEVTKDNITGFLDGTQQFTIPDDNLVDGRIGLGVWGADARFDDLKVFVPGGPTAVDPAGKVATTWSKIKAQF